MRITDPDVIVTAAGEERRVVLRLRTDAGLVGLGEVPLSGPTAALPAYLEAIGERDVRGADPFDSTRLVRRLLGDPPGRVGPLVAAAAGAVEVACWDLVGRSLGVPIYRLLGGAVRETIPACLSGWEPEDRSPASLAVAALEAIDRGARLLRLDPFGPGPAEPSATELRAAIRRAEAVRAAVGPDVELALSFGGRFAPGAAARAARAMERIEPAWVEDPVVGDDPAALAARPIRPPVALGRGRCLRADFREPIERRACDLIRPEPALGGGFAEARNLAALAETYGLRVILAAGGGPVATAAVLHLAAALPNLRAVEHAAASAPLIAGAFALPSGPGLGLAPDEDGSQASREPAR